VLTLVTLHPPEIGARRVRFQWTVEPPARLYRTSAFELRFPDALDATRLPDALWWRLAFVCLHVHWMLLSPCRVRIPVRLAPAEAEAWLRLMSAEKTSLEGHRPVPDWPLAVELDDAGPPLAPLPRVPEGGRCATSFSGGKDSLLQAGLLAELSPRPLLVAARSPMRGVDDHVARRRRFVLREIVRRRDFELLEIESDFRSVSRNRVSREQGLPAGVNELVDTFLYLACLIAAGFARDVPHLFMASEAEVQESIEREGHVVQHPHGVYSTATLRALSSLLEPAGVRLSTLTAPLHSFQVQRLLWQRYPDLAELQFSCWRVRRRQAWCHGCGQCLRSAYGALASGGSPARAGLDLATLLARLSDWQPPPAPAPPGLPDAEVRFRLNAHAARMIADTPLADVRRELARRPWRRLSPSGWRALQRAGALRARMQALDPPPLPGFRPGFLRQLDPLLRGRIESIYAEHFPSEPEAAWSAALERSDRLAAWLSEPHARASAEEPCPIRA
jgi:hypothetical protein